MLLATSTKQKYTGEFNFFKTLSLKEQNMIFKDQWELSVLEESMHPCACAMTKGS